MSSSLADDMSTDFAPEKFGDAYQEQLRELIAAKLEQGDGLDTAATFGEESDDDSGAEVVDLMEALRRSVEQNRSARAGRTAKTDDSVPETKPKPKPAKKTPAKKAAARKKSSTSQTSTKKGSASQTSTKKGSAKRSADKAATKKAS